MALIAPTLPDSCVSMILARLPSKQVPKHLPKKMIRDVALEALRNMPTPSQDETPKAFVARLIQSESPLLRLDVPLGAHKDLREVQGKIDKLTKAEIEMLLFERKEDGSTPLFNSCSLFNDDLCQQESHILKLKRYGQLALHWLSFQDVKFLGKEAYFYYGCQRLRDPIPLPYELIMEAVLKRRDSIVYRDPALGENRSAYDHYCFSECDALIKVIKKFPNKKIQLNIDKVTLTTFRRLKMSLDPEKVQINLINEYQNIQVENNQGKANLGAWIFLILVYGTLGFTWHPYFKAHVGLMLSPIIFFSLPIFLSPSVWALIKKIDLQFQKYEIDGYVRQHGVVA